MVKNSQKLTALSRVGMAILSGVLSASAFSYDGRITISGFVEEEGTCVIKTGSEEQAIELSDVNVKELSTAGETAKPKTFSISLSRCRTADYNNVKLKFSGYSVFPGVLQDFTSNSSARNVGFYITKLDSTPVMLLNGKDAEKASGTGVNAVQPRFDYIVSYYALGKATVGTVQIPLNFSIDYN